MPNEYQASIYEAKELRAALREANRTLREKQELIEALTSAPAEIATVAEVIGSRAYLSFHGTLVEQTIPAPIADHVRPGMTVRVNAKGGIAGVIKNFAAFGHINTVRNVLGKHCEIDARGGVSVVALGDVKAERGDRVIVDPSGMVVLKNLGKTDAENVFVGETNVSWDDIGGLEDAKKQLIEAVELPHKHPDIFKRYGKSIPKGILLYGPPGCGKTMIGKATATALAKIHGTAASTGFIYVKGPEILNKFVGESEAKIRRLFMSAREHYRTHGYPAVIFIDEAEAVLSKRGSSRSSDVDKTIVPMFLAEMDGLEEAGATVLLATNRADMLDPAVVREGRVDRKVKITRPDKQSASAIMNLHMRGKPAAEKETQESLVNVAIKAVFSDKKLSKIVSGSLLAAVVDYASSFAISRDLETEEFSGITKADILNAVAQVRLQNQDVSYQES